MKVLIVFNQPAPYKVNLFNELTKYFDLDVIFERKTCSNRNPLFYSENSYRFNCIFLKKGSFSEEQSNTNELKKYIKENHLKYDYIILNGYSTITEIKAIRYLSKKKIPFTLMINGGLIHNDKGIKRWLKKYLIPKANSYLSPSIISDEYLIHYGADKNKIFRYPNSTIFNNEIISDVLTIQEVKKLRDKINIPNDKKVLVCPTQFIDRKNNIQLIKLVSKLEDTILLLIGDGVLKETYEKIINENNIKNVKLYPYFKKEDLLVYYQLSDAVITLSKEDIYGHTINEAMSQGLPAISSNKVVSASHLIKNGVNGYIVSLENENEIVLAIKNINYDMKKEARKISLENTIEKSASIINDILKKL